MNLSQAKVLVTGGSSGIGLGTAELLIERGAKVAINGRDGGKLDQAAGRIGAVAVQGDVAEEKDAKRVVAQAIRELGGLDVLINNAGIARGWGSLTDLSTEDFDAVFATNTRGAMIVGREAARHFVKQNRGHIINVASTAAQRGFAGGTAYVASKFALVGMTECWRAELRKHNVRVQLIYPSEVMTHFFEAAGSSQKKSERKLRPDEIAHAMVSMLEMDDRGMVTELTVWATNPE